MSIKTKTLNFINTVMTILILNLNLIPSANAMKCLKISNNATCGKISVRSLQTYCENPNCYGIQDDINSNFNNEIYSKTDKLIHWIKSYNYDGSDFCFYNLLAVTLGYFSKIKPNHSISFIEESLIYYHQDENGFISYEDFKLCLVRILDKLR